MRHKKSENSNLEKKRKGILITGLMFASCFSLILLEWASFEAMATPTALIYDDNFVEHEIVPISVIKAKQKPEKQKTTKALLEILVDDFDEKDEDEIPMDDIPLDEEDFEEIPMEIEDFKEDTPFIIVEQMPRFPGGIRAMKYFLANNISYPRVATDARIEGTVYVQFIVGKNGEVEEVVLPSSNGKVRKVGGGCDEEAIRVVKKMPKWRPGKQRGKPVRVQFSIPVKFTLSN